MESHNGGPKRPRAWTSLRRARGRERRAQPAAAGLPRATRWRLPLVLFLATAVSLLYTGAHAAMGRPAASLRDLLAGWPYAVPLLAILLFHEFGHYIAARLHGVPASLPHFIPLPVLSPFGTMGAVISMPERIRSRNALLDIGAAGPLAGLFVALPTLVWGLALSDVRPVASLHLGYDQEGQSLLYWLVKRVVLGPIPEGHDVWLHPTAFAGWTGLFLTMINLVPWGQLDGGHIAYALGPAAHNRLAKRIRYGLLVFFVASLCWFAASALPARGRPAAEILAEAFGAASPWMMWFLLLSLFKRLGGELHPPCDRGDLSPRRRRVALASLVLFVALFMPSPLRYVPPTSRREQVLAPPACSRPRGGGAQAGSVASALPCGRALRSLAVELPLGRNGPLAHWGGGETRGKSGAHTIGHVAADVASVPSDFPYQRS